MAALDGLGMKVLELRMKQYGDKSKEQQVIDKRVENAAGGLQLSDTGHHVEVAASLRISSVWRRFASSAALFI